LGGNGIAGGSGGLRMGTTSIAHNIISEGESESAISGGADNVVTDCNIQSSGTLAATAAISLGDGSKVADCTVYQGTRSSSAVSFTVSSLMTSLLRLSLAPVREEPVPRLLALTSPKGVGGHDSGAGVNQASIWRKSRVNRQEPGQCLTDSAIIGELTCCIGGKSDGRRRPSPNRPAIRTGAARF
jgi:hypothetical protein